MKFSDVRVVLRYSILYATALSSVCPLEVSAKLPPKTSVPSSGSNTTTPDVWVLCATNTEAPILTVVPSTVATE